jgi:hypothetical protein
MSAVVVRQCKTCGKAFSVKAFRLAHGRGIFCSRACRDPMTLSQRFEAKVNRNGPTPTHRPELGPCAIWTAKISESGYGQIGMGSRRDGTKRVEQAHRVAFYLAHGRWPLPFACHHCDNRACVRHDHLFEGDSLANVRDMLTKGRGDHTRGPRGEQHYASKLTAEIVRSIRLAVASGETHQSIADRLNLGRQTVTKVAARKAWRHVA